METHSHEKSFYPVFERSIFTVIPELSSRNYKLVGVDLSQINTMEAALKLCDIDFDVPTLLLSEVVLTYMTRRW